MYPSTISTFTNPNANDRLNSPSHSSIESAQNAGINRIENYVGTLASTAGTLTYDIRSPDSNGGGHIQTANKGGTGQTAYTKGDLLIATSGSVLSKFAVSSVNGEVLTVDTGTATGVKWAGTIANKITVSSSTVGIGSILGVDTVIFAASILGSVLGTNNAVRFTGLISQFKLEGSANRGASFNVSYGNNTPITLTFPNANAAALEFAGQIDGMIVANNATNSQKLIMRFSGGNGTEESGNATVEFSKAMSTLYGTSSVESSATQNLIIGAQLTGAAGACSIISQAFVLEKIV